jgi:RNA polymerase sigma-70 factor (ECF subfamily)
MLLARLSPTDRLVLTLLDVEERSSAEVAQVVGWSATLVRVRAFRARRRLRAAARELEGPARPREKKQ